MLLLLAIAVPAGAIGAGGGSDKAPLDLVRAKGVEKKRQQEVVKQATREQWLATAEAAEERETSRTAYRSLGATAAASLLTAEFGTLVKTEPQLQVEEAGIVSFAGDYTAVLEQGAKVEVASDATEPDKATESNTGEADGTVSVGEKPPGAAKSDDLETADRGEDRHGGLVESSVPLRVPDENGDKVPVDLTLRADEAAFEPENPIVDLQLPKSLGDGFSLGGAESIGIEAGGLAPETAAKRIGEAALIYPNAAPDTDFVATPLPTGVEFYTQLRSPASPESQAYALDLPEGAQLRGTDFGGAEVVRDKETLAAVRPPTAVDAQGKPVAVSIRAEGNSLVLETPHRDRDVAYPILVDPIYESYQWISGAGNFAGWSVYEAPESPATTFSGFGWGIYTHAGAGAYPAGPLQTSWIYTIPRANPADPDATTAWIDAATLGQTSYLSGSGTGTQFPFFLAGIFSFRAPADWTYATYTFTPFSNQPVPLNPGGPVPGPKDDGQFLYMMLGDWNTSAVNHTWWKSAQVLNPVITLDDPEAPTQEMTNASFPTEWLKNGETPTYSFTAGSSDPGLGVKYQDLYTPAVGGTADLGEAADYELKDHVANAQTPTCTGGAQAPCDPSASHAFSKPVTANMPEGRHKVIVKSADPIGGLGHETQTEAGEIKIDRSGPTLKLSGTLPEAAGGELDAKTYALDVLARDGSTESPDKERSGVKEVTVTLDPETNPQTLASWNDGGSGCPQSSCEHPLATTTLDATGLTGPHTVRIESTDQLDNLTTKNLSFSVDGFAGVIVTPKSGDSTAQRFGLEAEGHNPAMTEVTFQYRRPGTGAWAAIPKAKLYLDDGTNPASEALPLDSEGKHAAVTWDVPATAGLATDGKVNLRAKFTGSGGPSGPDNDAALHWGLGEAEDAIIAADSSGNDRVGTYIANPHARVPGPASAPGDGAVDLNGTSQYIRSDYNPFQNGSTRTFTGWANRDTSGRLDFLLGGENPGGGGGSPFLVIGGNEGVPPNEVRFAPSHTGPGYYASGVAWPGAWPGVGIWAHWALVFYEGSEIAELFINGQTQGTRYMPLPYGQIPGNLRVGARLDQGDPRYFDGKLDEVAVYERALSLGEIQGLRDGSEKGFSKVVPLTLDRDDTTAKHASAPIGPGTVDLLTGNFAVTADDVKIDAWGSDLTVSRTFNSREPEIGSGDWTKTLGPGWVSSVPVDAAGSDYVQLSETGPSGDSKASIKVTTSDSTEILFNRSGTGYQVEPMFTGLELKATSNQLYELKDLGGNATTFYKPPGEAAYAPLKIRQTGAAGQNTTRIGYENFEGVIRRVKTVLAPTPAGVSCPDIGNGHFQLNRGCRALTFHYTNELVAPPQGGSGPYIGRLDHVTFHAWNGSSMTSVDVAKYGYDSAGRLNAAWDPRTATPPLMNPLKTTYTYDTSEAVSATGHLKTITPPGENAWTLEYDTDGLPAGSPNGPDADTGRLIKAKREVPGSGTATTEVVYGVPLSGSGLPDLSAGRVADWGQTDLPTDATAIKPPDSSDLTKATIHYMNRNGDLVNVANPGNPGNSDGEIATMEYESHRMVRRELTPQNRLTALAAGSSSASVAATLDTQNTYGADGTELLEVLGPQHQIQRQDNGQLINARAHTVTTYDQGRPTGQDYHLPTKVTVGAQPAGGGADIDVRTTKTDYNWALRQPTSVRVDPDGLNLTRLTTYDGATGLVTETRMPKAAGTADPNAHTSKTIYYTVGPHPSDAECGNKPEWANLPCKEAPAAQPGGALPELPITRYEDYNIWNQVESTRDDILGSLEESDRVSQTFYDDAGRPTASRLTGGEGTPLPQVNTSYSPTTGRVTSTSAGEGMISRQYDAIGRQTSYTDTDGATTTPTYDILGRPTNITESKPGGPSFSTDLYYDANTRRLKQMNVPGIGWSTAGYDADGKIVAEWLPNENVVSTNYNAVSEPTAKQYYRYTCVPLSNCPVMSFGATYSIHGQQTADSSIVGGEWHSNQILAYDAAGRLKTTNDWLEGSAGCTRRDYAYDKNSNRTSMRTATTLPGGACATDPNAGTVTTQGHDQADRVTDSGYTYDAFGRTLDVPAADAGGSQLTSTYYASDRVHTLTQEGVTQTFNLDSAQRVRSRATTGQPTQTYHYSDDSDSPSWITTGGSNWERYATSVGGSLSAVQSGHDSTTDSVTFQITNIHGDVVGETDDDGELTQTFDADEFGVPTAGEIPGSGYGWLGGKERRTQFDSGVVTMGQRVYLPQLGRFLQTDPVVGGSANDYDYVNQDPLNQLDLAGTQPDVSKGCGGNPPVCPRKCTAIACRYLKPRRGRSFPKLGHFLCDGNNPGPHCGFQFTKTASKAITKAAKYGIELAVAKRVCGPLKFIKVKLSCDGFVSFFIELVAHDVDILEGGKCLEIGAGFYSSPIRWGPLGSGYIGTPGC